MKQDVTHEITIDPNKTMSSAKKWIAFQTILVKKFVAFCVSGHKPYYRQLLPWLYTLSSLVR